MLENLYPQAVTPEGNRVAQQMLAEMFEPVDAHWRGLGLLPQSGLQLREIFADHDAIKRFNLTTIETREPAGCRCGDVICGMATPAECRLFGTGCTPVRPVGPCMVSSEGTCQAWFKYRRGGSRRVLAGGVA
jgi:hydrogenase expression/formation protein HypD